MAFFLKRFALHSSINEEQRLVHAACQQNRAAFDALVHAHTDRLRAFLIRRVGPDAAEDVLQETFLAAWQAIGRLDLRVRFKTWLFSIAVRKAADHHRARGRRAEAETAVNPEVLLSLPSENSEIRHIENRATVRLLLESLSDDQRQLLEMYYFAELTLPEIAQILNRNLNTLKYQFYRAHALAAAHLGEMNEPALRSAPSAKNKSETSGKSPGVSGTSGKAVLEQ
ncbi:MAG: sigma-70 family RNA polymerase sigma factor [Armatimonadaceae bacterium]